MPSKVIYTSPVLFIFKLNGGWRFYANYWKLNCIIEKDKYLSPLIDKTFRRIKRVKVFIKLNIWYVFHRIRIHPDSEELTAFGMYYGVY